jgi:hypothetical protein
MYRYTPILISLFASTACGPIPPGWDDGSGGTSSGRPPASSSTSDATSSTSDGLDDTAPSSSTDPTVPPDVPPPLDHCAAVDVLLVIDDSLDMGEYQTQLSLAFPGFVDHLWETLPPGTNVHVAATGSSMYDGDCAEVTMDCATAASSSDLIAHYIPPGPGWDNGVNGQQGRLFEYQDLAYFDVNTSDDSAELKQWGSGLITAIGTSGCAYEFPTATGSYVFDEHNLDEYNAGFVRDAGAVLAIVFLTSEPDKSMEAYEELQPTYYWGKVRDAKAECGEECTLAAAILDPCVEDVEPTDPLLRFMSWFRHTVPPGSVYEPTDYAMVLEQTASQIGVVCQGIGDTGL